MSISHVTFSLTTTEYLDESVHNSINKSLLTLFIFCLLVLFTLFFSFPTPFSPPFLSLSVLLLYTLSRRDGGTGSSLAYWHLPQWKEWSYEQPAGHRQHGRGVLHVGGSHGSQPYHLHLRTPFLLAVQALLYGCLLWQAWHGLLHQQSKCFDLDAWSSFETA